MIDKKRPHRLKVADLAWRRIFRLSIHPHFDQDGAYRRFRETQRRA